MKRLWVRSVGFSKKTETTTITDRKFLWWTLPKPKVTTSVSYSSGHTFIIDGYYNMSCIAKKENSEIRITDNFVHCNPGWGGNKNGYYLSGIFDMRSNHLIADDNQINSRSTSSTTTDLGKYNYGFNLMQITNIRPKK